MLLEEQDKGGGRMLAVDAQVMAKFRDGAAPSDIDAELKLARGTAHDIIVNRWAVEKESHHHRGTEYGGGDDLIGA